MEKISPYQGLEPRAFWRSGYGEGDYPPADLYRPKWALSKSDRIVWLMEELNLPYRLKWYDRGPDFLAPAEYRALHPAGTAPIITDGDLVMAESTAIVEYISQRHGGGRLSVNPDEADYPHYLFWMQFNNNLQSALFIKLAFQTLGAEILGVSRDSLKSHENFRCKQSFPFELLSDSDESLCRLFDVIKLKNMYGREVQGIERSTFLIDPDGRLAAEWRKVSVKGHAADVLERLRSLTAG